MLTLVLDNQVYFALSRREPLRLLKAKFGNASLSVSMPAGFQHMAELEALLRSVCSSPQQRRYSLEAISKAG
jgi:hypothetical protein